MEGMILAERAVAFVPLDARIVLLSIFLTALLAVALAAAVLPRRRRKGAATAAADAPSQGSTTAQEGAHEVATAAGQSVDSPATPPLSPFTATASPVLRSPFASQLAPGPVTLDVPDGVHYIEFADGSSYSGEMHGGLMHGRGVFMWQNGDRYEGEWRGGKQEGQGTFAASDGSMFLGGWKDGKMDGHGVYKPAVAVAGPDARSSRQVVYLREYAAGELLKDAALRMVSKSSVRKQQAKAGRKRSATMRPLQPGEIIYKGHHSYDLMRQLQLGIMYSIAQAGLEAENDAPIKPADFSAQTVQYFPAGTSGETGAFTWKDYGPRVFHRLRAVFRIDPEDYLVSLTGGPALREIPTPGQSGCIFFLSGDDRFFVKSVRKEEMVLVLHAMPRYFTHVVAHPETLLVHFYGLHRISPWLGRNARFLVMGNVLPTDRRMHRKYDLKGSSYKRTVGEGRRRTDPGATLKDLDVDLRFELTPDRYEHLMLQLQRDTELLRELSVMDYSLLLGVHFLRWGDEVWYPPGEDWPVGSAADSMGAQQLSDAASSAVLPGAVATEEALGAEAEADVGGQGDDDGGGEEDGAAHAMGASDPTRSLRQVTNRQGSLAAGHSLAYNLQQLSTADTDAELSRTAASVVESVTHVRQAARLSAAAATSTSTLDLTALGNEPTLPGIILPTPSAPLAGQLSLPGSPSARQASVPARHVRSSNKEERCRWAVPATALRTSSTGEVVREPVMLYLALIDFLQHWRLSKQLEHLWKAAMHGNTVSVCEPSRYASRFLDAMGSLFVAAEES